jgi:RNA polymerase sigma factor (sigma-70 family)
MSTDVKLDNEFFERLFELYAKDVRNVLQGQRIPEADQEDLVQEVFARAVRKYDPMYDAKAWLLVAALNVARNWRRRAWRRELLGYPAEPVDQRSPEQDASDREIEARIHSVIDDSMNHELRLVFTLVRIDGIPIEQVAQMLHVRVSTVQSMLRRANRAFLDEGRRRHAAGALLSWLVLLAAGRESRWRAGVHEVMKCTAGAVVGAGIVLALMRSQAVPTPIHAEPPRVAETRWSAVPMPPVADPVPAPPVDSMLASPVVDTPTATDPVPAPRLAQSSPPGRDEAVRDELMLIERAKKVIRQGRYDEGLQYLERHRRIYPAGKMSTVRDELIDTVQQRTGKSTKISG